MKIVLTRNIHAVSGCYKKDVEYDVTEAIYNSLERYAKCCVC